MTDKRTVTKARVRVTIEFEVPDNWGDDCALSQVRRQATESAHGLIRTGFILYGSRRRESQQPTTEATIIGTPEVTAILVER